MIKNNSALFQNEKAGRHSESMETEHEIGENLGTQT